MLEPLLAVRLGAHQGRGDGRPKKQAELTEVRRENAELEFLQLRLAELPDTYKLDGANLKGPDGTLLPKAVIEGLPDRIHQNKQVYGRFVSRDD